MKDLLRTIKDDINAWDYGSQESFSEEEGYDSPDEDELAIRNDILKALESFHSWKPIETTMRSEKRSDPVKSPKKPTSA